MKRLIGLGLLALLIGYAATVLAAAIVSYFPDPNYGGWKVTAEFCQGPQP